MAANSRLRVVVVTLQPDPSESLLFIRTAGLVGDLVIVAPEGPDASPWPSGVRAIRLPAIGASLTRKWLMRLARTIRSLDPDMVHVHGEPWSITCQYLVGLGLPVVVHGAESVLVDAPLVSRLRRTGTKRVLRRVAGYAAWGTTGLRAVRRAGLPETTPAAVIPGSPPDPTVFSPVGLGTVDRGLRVLAVGRLVTEKGFDSLVRAVAACADTTGISIRVVGDGPQRHYLHQLARETGVDAAFTGMLDSRHVHREMADSHVLVAPSVASRTRQEQWGRAVVEAMMTGRAVIVSDCGELPYLVGDRSWTFPSGNVSALAESLTELRDSPSLLEVRAEGALARSALFHPDRLTEELVLLWEQAVAGVK